MAALTAVPCSKARSTLSPRERRPDARFKVLGALALAAMLGFAGCRVGQPSDALTLRSERAPTDILVAVALAAQKCWYADNEQAFADYRLADEVHSSAGRPRLLLVPRRDPTGLPLLVVQAERRGGEASGTFSEIQAYGPLLAGPHGKRITDDVRRWAGGNDDCA